MRDFTLEKYRELCIAVKEKYTPTTVYEYFRKYRHKDWVAVLRHDVDRFPKMALNMAKVEYKLDVNSTYYFRYPYTFNEQVIKEIIDMGHEIGYHYECLGKAKGDPEKAIEIFREEIKAFEELGVKIKTICAHGQPLSKWLNTDLWKYYDFTKFGIIAEAFLSFENENNVVYFSDTGRTWGGSVMKAYSLVNEKWGIKSTDDLIKFIRNTKAKKLYILTHPERWGSNIFEWSRYLILDYVFNIGKHVLTTFRSTREGDV